MSQVPQVFISYARDGGVSEQTATALHQQLVQAGIAAFRDVENIDPGSHWAAVIEQQILASHLMVVVVSKPALDPQRWVMRECLFAANKRIPIIPLLVEQVELPLWLTHINALDFTQVQPWNRLLVTIGKYVPADMERVVVVPPQFQSQKSETPRPVVIPSPSVTSQQQPDYSPEVQQLLQELQNPQVQPPRRLEIGNRLNAIGDTRPGGGIDVKTGLPDIDWVKIPSGAFTYQNGERLHLDDYYMSRYPVTNRQFQAFETAGGYQSDEWWKGLTKPDSLPTHRWKEANRPVESVDWYESIAFCRWLSAQTGKEIRLPTEQEWEKAARGADGREYPWGDGYQVGFANIDESAGQNMISKLFSPKRFYLEQTTAVGIYPQGASPYGLMDMSGNVWEWCLNKYAEPSMITPDLSGGVRVVRGGAWYFIAGYCRSPFRYHWDPVNRLDVLGFRLLCCFPH
jgi:formylglycine-generating enzyme required for sulfatase activity